MSEQKGGDLFEAAGWNPQNPKFGDSEYAANAGDQAKVEYLAKGLGGWGYGQFVPLVNFFIIVLGWFSVTVEVFLRRRFGVRYLSFARYVLGGLALIVVLNAVQLLAFVPLLGRRVSQGETLGALVSFVFLQGLVGAYFVIGMLHGIRTWVRHQEGVRWFSWSFGVSWFGFLLGTGVGPLPVPRGLRWLLGERLPRLRVDDWTLFRLIEPVSVMVLAFLVGRTGLGAVSLWLWLGGVTLLVKNNYLYRQDLHLRLDLADAEIRNHYLQAARLGVDKSQTAGFSAVTLPFSVGGEAPPSSGQTAAEDSNWKLHVFAAVLLGLALIGTLLPRPGNAGVGMEPPSASAPLMALPTRPTATTNPLLRTADARSQETGGFVPPVLPGEPPVVPTVATVTPIALPPPMATVEPALPGLGDSETLAGGHVYRVRQNSDGFAAVRVTPSTQIHELGQLLSGTRIVCKGMVQGEAIAGTDQWADCPAVGGYVFAALLEPVDAAMP